MINEFSVNLYIFNLLKTERTIVLKNLLMCLLRSEKN